MDPRVKPEGDGRRGGEGGGASSQHEEFQGVTLDGDLAEVAVQPIAAVVFPPQGVDAAIINTAVRIGRRLGLRHGPQPLHMLQAGEAERRFPVAGPVGFRWWRVARVAGPEARLDSEDEIAAGLAPGEDETVGDFHVLEFRHVGPVQHLVEASFRTRHRFPPTRLHRSGCGRKAQPRLRSLGGHLACSPTPSLTLPRQGGGEQGKGERGSLRTRARYDVGSSGISVMFTGLSYLLSAPVAESMALLTPNVRITSRAMPAAPEPLSQPLSLM